MTITPDPNLSREDRTPYNESRALKAKLSDLTVSGSTYPGGTLVVPVRYINPDFEFGSAEFPGIYIAYADTSRATEREVRGPTNLQYAPPGYPADVLVPEDFEDKDSAVAPWNANGFDRLTSPYHVQDHPIPYNLDFNIAVLTRNYQQAFELISQLQEVEYLPERFGSLEVPEDGTIRTLELLGGPDTSVVTDEDGKRLVQTLYSVRVAAEISLYDVETVRRVSTVQINHIETYGIPHL